ncbi:MAG: nucleotide exchange factor GrpE [Oscillospiraceae bacterium]|nr:nucleotide exchange factor GrpE [Oscillospiraceae bacterium]
MAKNKKKENPVSVPEDVQDEAAEAPEQEAPEAVEAAEEAPEVEAPKPEPKPQKDQGQLLAEAADKYLRLAAEYDNYRKRTAKEKEAIWPEAKAQTVAAFLPVYDNLERALKQDTADEAYKKGVEMTMKGLQDALTGLGVEVIPALGETFDPNRHNAVMHVDDPEAGENTIVEVFQQGFLCGEKVIRFSVVKVAN